MKTALFISALVLCSFSYAQKVVALHSGGAVTMFNTTNPFQDAYTAAVNGDTIYLPGGSLVPPNTIDKQLVIIGVGYHADSTQATFPTFITTGFNLGENADFSILEGLWVNGGIGSAYNSSFSNTQIRRCRLDGAVSFSGDGSSNPIENLLISECILSGNNGFSNVRTSMITNSIIQSQLNSTYSNVIRNCIFLREGGSFSSAPGKTVYEAYNTTFENTIFFNSNVYSVHGNGNVFENVLFANATPQLGSAPIENNNYYGVPQATIFVNETDFTWSESDDHHLQDPVTYTGNDATPVGVYGGFNPYKTGAVPHNPHFSAKTIAPQTDASGQLNIQITTTAQDN